MPQKPIQRRNIRLRFDEARQRHWHSGNARITRLFDAMSMSFPPGEKSFIDTVRQFAGSISDPALREDIEVEEDRVPTT